MGQRAWGVEKGTRKPEKGERRRKEGLRGSKMYNTAKLEASC
jgi:hypothetical protein